MSSVISDSTEKKETEEQSEDQLFSNRFMFKHFNETLICANEMKRT